MYRVSRTAFFHLPRKVRSRVWLCRPVFHPLVLAGVRACVCFIPPHRLSCRFFLALLVPPQLYILHSLCIRTDQYRLADSLMFALVVRRSRHRWQPVLRRNQSKKAHEKHCRRSNPKIVRPSSHRPFTPAAPLHSDRCARYIDYVCMRSCL